MHRLIGLGAIAAAVARRISAAEPGANLGRRGPVRQIYARGCGQAQAGWAVHGPSILPTP